MSNCSTPTPTNAVPTNATAAAAALVGAAGSTGSAANGRSTNVSPRAASCVLDSCMANNSHVCINSSDRLTSMLYVSRDSILEAAKQINKHPRKTVVLHVKQLVDQQSEEIAVQHNYVRIDQSTVRPEDAETELSIVPKPKPKPKGRVRPRRFRPGRDGAGRGRGRGVRGRGGRGSRNRGGAGRGGTGPGGAGDNGKGKGKAKSKSKRKADSNPNGSDKKKAKTGNGRGSTGSGGSGSGSGDDSEEEDAVSSRVASAVRRAIEELRLGGDDAIHYVLGAVGHVLPTIHSRDIVILGLRAYHDAKATAAEASRLSVTSLVQLSEEAETKIKSLHHDLVQPASPSASAAAAAIVVPVPELRRFAKRLVHNALSNPEDGDPIAAMEAVLIGCSNWYAENLSCVQQHMKSKAEATAKSMTFRVGSVCAMAQTTLSLVGSDECGKEVKSTSKFDGAIVAARDAGVFGDDVDRNASPADLVEAHLRMKPAEANLLQILVHLYAALIYFRNSVEDGAFESDYPELYKKSNGNRSNPRDDGMDVLVDMYNYMHDDNIGIDDKASLAKSFVEKVVEDKNDGAVWASVDEYSGSASDESGEAMHYFSDDSPGVGGKVIGNKAIEHRRHVTISLLVGLVCTDSVKQMCGLADCADLAGAILGNSFRNLRGNGFAKIIQPSYHRCRLRNRTKSLVTLRSSQAPQWIEDADLDFGGKAFAIVDSDRGLVHNLAKLRFVTAQMVEDEIVDAQKDDVEELDDDIGDGVGAEMDEASDTNEDSNEEEEEEEEEDEEEEDDGDDYDHDFLATDDEYSDEEKADAAMAMVTLQEGGLRPSDLPDEHPGGPEASAGAATGAAREGGAGAAESPAVLTNPEASAAESASPGTRQPSSRVRKKNQFHANFITLSHLPDQTDTEPEEGADDEGYTHGQDQEVIAENKRLELEVEEQYNREFKEKSGEFEESETKPYLI